MRSRRPGGAREEGRQAAAREEAERHEDARRAQREEAGLEERALLRRLSAGARLVPEPHGRRPPDQARHLGARLAEGLPDALARGVWTGAHAEIDRRIALRLRAHAPGRHPGRPVAALLEEALGLGADWAAHFAAHLPPDGLVRARLGPPVEARAADPGDPGPGISRPAGRGDGARAAARPDPPEDPPGPPGFRR